MKCKLFLMLSLLATLPIGTTFSSRGATDVEAISDAASVPLMVEQHSTGGIWSGYIVISPNPASYSDWPAIAVDNKGWIYVLWTDSVDPVGPGSIFTLKAMYTARDPKGAWSPSAVLTDFGFQGFGRDLATDENGNLYAVWPSSQEIFYSTKRGVNENWSTPLNISGDVGIWAHYPSMAIDSAGTIHVVWVDELPNDPHRASHMFYTSKPAGGSWALPVDIFPGFGTPDIAIDSNGTVHVVFSTDTPDSTVYYKSLSGGIWSLPLELWHGSYGGPPKIATDSTKTIHVVWIDASISEREKLLYTHSENGSWSSPTVISDSGHRAYAGADIAVDKFNTLHVVWGCAGIADIADDGLEYTSRTKNGNWSHPVVAVATDGASLPINTELAISPSGDLYAVWNDSAVRNIYFSERRTVFLDLPIDYTSTNFAKAAQGNIEGSGPGKVNSWFDHQYPSYNNYPNSNYPGLLRWDGRLFPNPTRLGEGAYDGHNGIDFQASSGDSVFPSTPGVVLGVVTGCQVGDKTCGGGFGNQLWINHGNGYATRYGHLSSVLVSNGASVTTQAIGTIGTTGNSTGPHLHFGVYFDTNNDGVWTESEVVDPYGWSGTGTDPLNPASEYLWKYPLWVQQSVGTSGATLTSPSGRGTANIPSGALTSTLTVEFWDAPVAKATSWLRSLGISFWLRVLEWLNGTLSPSKSLRLATTTNSFAQPVQIQANLDPALTSHLDMSNLTIQLWNETAGAWTPLTTTTSGNTATAQTTQPGQFDLQAPLLCPSDSRETDDDFSAATLVATDGTITSDLFDIQADQDWFKFTALQGTKYRIETMSLAIGVDTIIELYGADATTLIAVDDNSAGGKASKLEWQAPSAGTYFVQVKQARGSLYGCNANYKLRVLIPQNKIYLPLIRK